MVPPFALQTPLTRSMGFKLFSIGALALIMMIPAWFVERLVEDRSLRANEVSESISGQFGGEQTFLGPVLAVPYTMGKSSGVYIIFPGSGDADLATKSEVRQRSLFKVPVYAATIRFKAAFDLTSSGANPPAGTVLDWSRAEFITGASGARGALADVTISEGGASRIMALSGLLDRLPLNVPNQPGVELKIFGARPAERAGPGSKFELAATMKFSGSRQISVLPFGDTTGITVSGDWPHPGFNGGFLPSSQTTGPTGFQAHWSMPFIARGVAAEGDSRVVTRLLPLAPVVALIELANPWQSVTRSLKYAILFLGLVFSAFFIFETTTGKLVHPAQYFLVGVAQLIFYLLLLSIAERIGFGAAFAIASAATVSLISINARWIFNSRVQGARAFAVFSLVYGLIYILLTLEDQALLIGSIAGFVATAAIMYFTRSIDWYSQESSAADI